MALSELALLSLAWSLAVNPSDADIQKYQSLSQSEQIEVQKLIEQKDTLPAEIEELKKQGMPDDSSTVNRAPTTETMM